MSLPILFIIIFKEVYILLNIFFILNNPGGIFIHSQEVVNLPSDDGVACQCCPEANESVLDQQALSLPGWFIPLVWLSGRETEVHSDSHSVGGFFSFIYLKMSGFFFSVISETSFLYLELTGS